MASLNPVFDPLSVPIQGWDSHLPPVAPQRLSATALQQRFLKPPPWQAELGQELPWLDRQPTAAAVLLAIVLREMPTVLLTRRTDTLPTHSGQIALPGGKIDAGETPIQAAVREAHEEVGLHPSQVQVLGALPPYLSGSGFQIIPIVATVPAQSRLQANPGEVAQMFEVPLAFLMNPAHHARQEFVFNGHQRSWYSMPWHDSQTGQTHFIWGATAGMLRNLYHFLAA